ncbi:MAG: hypothetical protein AB7I98_03975 [Verrucomicrobiales bacterium]
MNKLKEILLKSLIGKNAPHLGRRIATFVGSLLLLTAPFSATPQPLDPAIADVAVEEGGHIESAAQGDTIAEEINLPSVAEVNDGLTTSEIIHWGGGFLLILGSRVTSFLRAKNVGWLANIFGFLIGRGVHSAVRAGMTGLSAYLTVRGFTPNGDGSFGLAELLSAGLVWGATGLYSWWQDGRQNPVPAK